MRKSILSVLVALVLGACGGSGSSGSPEGSASLPDPCMLIDTATLEEYFEPVPTPEPGGSGSFLTCTWSDANANAVSVSVANSSTVNRPDPCPGCIDLSYGDDGYATAVPLQAKAEFVSGAGWFAVTTTGLGDDGASIAALGEKVFETAMG